MCSPFCKHCFAHWKEQGRRNEKQFKHKPNMFTPWKSKGKGGRIGWSDSFWLTWGSNWAILDCNALLFVFGKDVKFLVLLVRDFLQRPNLSLWHASIHINQPNLFINIHQGALQPQLCGSLNLVISLSQSDRGVWFCLPIALSAVLAEIRVWKPILQNESLRHSSATRGVG